MLSKTCIKYKLQSASGAQCHKIAQKIVELENFLAPEEAKELEKKIKLWIQKYPRSIWFYADKDLETFLAYAWCVPISWEAYHRILQAKKFSPIRNLLHEEDYLDQLQVQHNIDAGLGNACYAHLFTPIDNTNGSIFLSLIPLLREFHAVFFLMRIKALVCQSRIPAFNKIVEDAGCVKLVSEKGMSLWHFDFNTALQKPTSGLGVIFHNLWSTKDEESVLGFSDREKEMIYLALQGFTDKEIAQKLGISTGTVDVYWKRAKEKFRTYYGLNEEAHKNQIIAFCATHLVEVVPRLFH
jgi:hypothetical protein